ncbi:MAG: hypothetical protein U5R14_13410 [Gemmatimonadota bacterium]|nr:hypothetical protein [Gemmatimonadota bacterium]
MGDVPGVCAVPLTRAIVQYRDVHEMDLAGGRIEDIGMALVVNGRYAAASEALDLGSGRAKVLDLSTELVVLDWAYEPTQEHVTELMERAADAEGMDALRRYAFRVGLRVLERVGFGPLTRPILLRIGYRDICRDFDLHEGTSIRILLGSGRVVRAHLDYEGCAVVFRTALHERDVALEQSLFDAFPDARLRRVRSSSPESGLEYHVQFGLPMSFGETRSVVASMRSGLARITARFEPDRFSELSRVVETFGARETLSGLNLVHTGADFESVGSAFTSSTVH